MRNAIATVLAVIIGAVTAKAFHLDGIGYYACFMIFVWAFLYLFQPMIARESVTLDYGFKRPPITYKASVCIWVKPEAVFGDVVVKKDGHHFSKILNDPEIEVEKDMSFLGRDFRYTFIKDETSGLSLIYDESLKTFIDEVIEHGAFLRCNAKKLKEKYSIENSLINRNLVIENGFIGPADPYAPGAGMSGKPISSIPVEAIIDALTRLSVSGWDPMHAIKTFPKELQKHLDENKIKYDTSDVNDYGIGVPFSGKEMDKKYAEAIRKKTGMDIYDDKLNTHTFENEHVVAHIAIKFGEKLG